MDRTGGGAVEKSELVVDDYTADPGSLPKNVVTDVDDDLEVLDVREKAGAKKCRREEVETVASFGVASEHVCYAAETDVVDAANALGDVVASEL